MRFFPPLDSLTKEGDARPAAEQTKSRIKSPKPGKASHTGHDEKSREKGGEEEKLVQRRRRHGLDLRCWMEGRDGAGTRLSSPSPRLSTALLPDSHALVFPGRAEMRVSEWEASGNESRPWQPSSSSYRYLSNMSCSPTPPCYDDSLDSFQSPRRGERVGSQISDDAGWGEKFPWKRRQLAPRLSESGETGLLIHSSPGSPAHTAPMKSV